MSGVRHAFANGRITTKVKYIRPGVKAPRTHFSVARRRHQTSSRCFSAMNSLPRIHVLGVGNLGRLFAHALANQPNPPPITLLLHRPSLVAEWEKAGRKIEITTGGVPSSTGSFDVEVIDDSSKSNAQNLASPASISNVIVTTKTLNTANAIASIQHRLTSQSTILFCQNGMGTFEEVTSFIFPDPFTRPHYLAAVTSHGVYSTGPFRSVHAGQANITISHVSTQAGSDPNPNSNVTSKAASPPPSSFERAQYLLNQITHTPILSATEVTPLELRNLQLDKLAINAMLNPLTAIFRCKNGDLFSKLPILHLARRLLAEVSQVLLLSLPDVRSAPTEARERFSASALEAKVLSVAAKTAGNTSSMLQDVLAGRETEIEYINGWVVRMGRESGVDCATNEILVGMVKEEKVIRVEEIEKYFPA